MSVDYQKAYEREKEMRKLAEQLLEDKSRELYSSLQTTEQALEDLRHSQKQLVQTEKMASLGVLAAGVAHEINNPIGYITSNFNSMKSGLTDIQSFIEKMSQAMSQLTDLNEIKSQWLGLLKKYDLEFLLEDFIDLSTETAEGLSRVKNIVSDLRTFAREDSTDMSIVDINECLESSLNILENQTKYHAKVNTDLLENLPQTLGYAGKLNQVFTNIISNANQAVDDNGIIDISSNVFNNQIVIKITDNGSGIEEKNLENLFTPFFTTKPVGEGTGLGLSISHGIIEEHNGTIKVESQVGIGTTFSILIPIKSEAVE